MQEFIVNNNFKKLASMQALKSGYNAWDKNTNYQGKIYTGLAGAGAYAGARGSKFLNDATRAITGMRGTYGAGRGALIGAGAAMGLKGAYDYNRWINQGKMTGKQLGLSAGLHGGLGGVLGSALAGGKHGSMTGALLGAGAGLAYKAYKDYKKYGG